jgi:cyclopropane fatty-acyl-phospholipid synthase-like methyltransferase
MPKGKLLEVGCGSGALMHLLSSDFGFEIEGVEISSAARKYHSQRNQLVYETAVEDLGFEDRYNGIYMWSVADHFSDPLAAFQSCYKALKKGGVMLIANINTDGFDIKTMGSDSVIFTPPSRVNFYNLISLRKQVEMAGFKVKSQETIGKLDVEIVKKYFEDKKINEVNGFLEYLILNKNMDQAREKFQLFLQESKLSGFQLIIATKE